MRIFVLFERRDICGVIRAHISTYFALVRLTVFATKLAVSLRVRAYLVSICDSRSFIKYEHVT